MATIKLTANHKTFENWKGSLTEYLEVGDSVCDELQAHILEVLPPACYDATLIQMGEAHDHLGPNGRPRFLTIQKRKGAWIYIGIHTLRTWVSFEDDHG